MKQYIPERRGAVLSLAGEKIGEHVGAQFYTIGQRHGVGNLKHERGNRIHEPLYVSGKDIQKNTVTVVAEVMTDLAWAPELSGTQSSMLLLALRAQVHRRLGEVGVQQLEIALAMRALDD